MKTNIFNMKTCIEHEDGRFCHRICLFLVSAALHCIVDGKKNKCSLFFGNYADHGKKLQKITEASHSHRLNAFTALYLVVQSFFQRSPVVASQWYHFNISTECVASTRCIPIKSYTDFLFIRLLVLSWSHYYFSNEQSFSCAAASSLYVFFSFLLSSAISFDPCCRLYYTCLSKQMEYAIFVYVFVWVWVYSLCSFVGWALFFSPFYTVPKILNKYVNSYSNWHTIRAKRAEKTSILPTRNRI